MKEQCLKQAELRTQRSRKNIKNWKCDLKLRLRNSGVRLTSFSASIPTSINQFLLTRQVREIMSVFCMAKITSP